MSKEFFFDFFYGLGPGICYSFQLLPSSKIIYANNYVLGPISSNFERSRPIISNGCFGVGIEHNLPAVSPTFVLNVWQNSQEFTKAWIDIHEPFH